jgi:transposase
VGAERLLGRLLEEGDPQKRGYRSTGWTVPMLKAELEKGGDRVSERTVRRTLHRLGFRWKRPKYVLGRPDPDYEQKKGK